MYPSQVLETMHGRGVRALVENPTTSASRASPSGDHYASITIFAVRESKATLDRHGHNTCVPSCCGTHCLQVCHIPGPWLSTVRRICRAAITVEVTAGGLGCCPVAIGMAPSVSMAADPRYPNVHRAGVSDCSTLFVGRLPCILTPVCAPIDHDTTLGCDLLASVRNRLDIIPASGLRM